jgi:peptidoglycan/xylan/chitin deacetylase (PgdA/CDA1 family)
MPDALVLCYHALSPDWPAALSTTPERFREQLDLLLGRGYRGATFEQAVVSGDRHAFAVTFDDAYRSVFALARPIMDELGVPGTVFVPTDWAGSADPMRWDGVYQWLDGPHRDEMLCMGWDELRELADAGWEIGSHTRSHPYLTAVDDERLGDELRESRLAVERELGRPCRSIAYPYGDVDARVVEAAGEAGYEFGASLPKKLGSRAPLDYPRVGVYNVDDLRRFRLKVSPFVRRVRRYVS